MLSAKEMFEFAKSRNDKLKDEKFKLVEKSIQDAAEREQFKTTFSFISLKPFVGAIVEKLSSPELGYKVTQSGQSIVVSWDQPQEKQTDDPPALTDDDNYDDSDDDGWQSSGNGC